MVEQENQKQNESGKPQNAEQSQSPSMFGTNGTPQSSDEQSKKKYNANNLAEQIRHTDHVIAWSAGITACLTLVLAIFTGLQAYSFIESERAYLIVDNIAFRHSEPTLDFDGLDLVITIKNVGKHMALVTTLDILPLFGTNHKELPNIPN